jgi:glycosyltransferase involved in cell wall biosynthesis
VRTLCLLTKTPLPPDNGSRQRMLHLIRALHSLGDVDFVFDRPLPDADRQALAAAFTTARIWSPPPAPAAGPLRRIRWLTKRRLPLRLALLDPLPLRRAIAMFVAASPEPYDLVWSQTAAPSWLAGPAVRAAPLVIDFADVQRTLLDRPLQLARRSPERWTAAGLKTRVRLRVERDRWTRFERTEGNRANLVTVCSAVDREAHGIPGALVLPNGYDRPAMPLGRRAVSEPPVVLLAGQLTYGPNIDGARWFVGDVLPLLRERIPGIEVALVGRTTPAVEALGRADGVDVRGYVDDIDAELARADLVIVPLREGSGTRIKILEAWAHHLPVVSTTVGAEGLGAEHGRDLLLADDARAFADAVVRALRDADLRAALVAAGAAHFESTYDWAHIEEQFLEHVQALVARATRFDRIGRL